MPTIEAATVDEVLVLTEHPRIPSSRKAVALVLDLDTAAYVAFETFVRSSRTSPVLRLGFGEDKHAAELAAVQKLLKDAEAEVARYRAAYDKSPPSGTHFFSQLEID